jgi:hypothetical protein
LIDNALKDHAHTMERPFFAIAKPGALRFCVDVGTSEILKSGRRGITARAYLI